MARKVTPRPTDGEMLILSVLWKCPGSTIRQIQAEMGPGSTAYSTLQTMLRIMEEKGYVYRGEERYPTRHYPKVNAEVMKKSLLRDFVRRVFGGSAENLVLQAIESEVKDLEKIKKAIDEMKD